MIGLEGYLATMVAMAIGRSRELGLAVGIQHAWFLFHWMSNQSSIESLISQHAQHDM